MKNDIFKKIVNLKKQEPVVKNLVTERNENQATIFIYDVIDSFWGVGAAYIIDTTTQLMQDGVTEFLVRINSPGGCVFEGLAIYNHLKTLSVPVTIQIDGGAHSIASIIAMAGTKVTAMEASLMMIHDPWSFIAGNSNDLRKVADILDKHRDTLADIYALKTGKGVDEIKSLMTNETWMSAQEALDNGFIDEIVASKNSENTAPEDLQNKADLIMNILHPEVGQKENFQPVEEKENDTHQRERAQARARALVRVATLNQ